MHDQQHRPSVAVVSIAKDEENNVPYWARYAHEADLVMVLDTGSSDSTVQVLLDHDVQTAIWYDKGPFDFSRARNHLLSLLPNDIDYVLWSDLDEYLPYGWRGAFEDTFKQQGPERMFSVTRLWGPLRYERAVLHSRHGWHWERPVHEYLVFGTPAVTDQPGAVPTGIEVEHIQDPDKDRSQYLDLMKIGTEQRPDDQQLSFWYARELMYHHDHPAARAEFHRFLELTGVWDVERMQAYIHLGDLYWDTGRTDDAAEHYMLAQAAAKWRREGYLALARFWRGRGNKAEARANAARALEITDRPGDYLSSEDSWNDEMIKKGFGVD